MIHKDTLLSRAEDFITRWVKSLHQLQKIKMKDMELKYTQNKDKRISVQVKYIHSAFMLDKERIKKTVAKYSAYLIIIVNTVI